MVRDPFTYFQDLLRKYVAIPYWFGCGILIVVSAGVNGPGRLRVVGAVILNVLAACALCIGIMRNRAKRKAQKDSPASR